MNFRLQDSYWQRDHHFQLREDEHPIRLDKVITTLKLSAGIIEAEAQHRALRIVYDLREINLTELLDLLRAEGLKLDESLRFRLYCFVECYRQSIRLAEKDVDYGWDTWIQDAYVSRYRRRRHGRRDDRLSNWRNYEAPAEWPTESE